MMSGVTMGSISEGRIPATYWNTVKKRTNKTESIASITLGWEKKVIFAPWLDLRYDLNKAEARDRTRLTLTV
jgi:hypothetical protein